MVHDRAYHQEVLVVTGGAELSVPRSGSFAQSGGPAVPQTA